MNRPAGPDVPLDGYDATGAADLEGRIENLAERDPLGFLNLCRDHYRRTYRDYTCTSTKQERIKGKVGHEQTMAIKFREEPYSVNMLWVSGARSARHVTYIAGRWPDDHGQEQAWCEPAGAIARIFVKKILQPINGKYANKESRRTISQFGFANTLDLIIRYSQKSYEEGTLDLRYVGRGSINDRPTLVFERRLPYTGQEKPYPARLLEYHIDREWLLPTGCFSYADDHGNELLGRYLLTDAQFNQGFTDKDFGPETLAQ